MDLDYLNHPYLSSYLIHQYMENSQDTGLLAVLNFYKCYRAYVRGKVAGFKLNDPHISKQEKDKICDITHQYFSLAAYYAQLMQVQMMQKKPVIFMIAGITGTGKSTVAQKLAIDYQTEVLNTDIVRKKQAGMDVYERHHDPFDQGLYSPDNIDRTYQMVADKAGELLARGEHVIVDATFRKQSHREMISSVADKQGATLIQLHCSCDDSVAQARLHQRVQSKSVSDGRWEIYHQQKKSFEPFNKKEKVVLFDTGKDSYTYRMKMFSTIATTLLEV